MYNLPHGMAVHLDNFITDQENNWSDRRVLPTNVGFLWTETMKVTIRNFGDTIGGKKAWRI